MQLLRAAACAPPHAQIKSKTQKGTVFYRFELFLLLEIK
tara:strand:- start:296 stop:412 length:117 start_codon:yes stop_codon:yes gene_type:complete